MSILQGTDKAGVSGKEQKTLHLNGFDTENMEAPQTPVDGEKAKAAQAKYEGEIFYGSSRGIEKMTKAEMEARIFDERTKDGRVNPVINHGHVPAEPDQEGKDHE